MKVRYIVLLCCALLIAAAPSVAQDRPNFSGNWILNKAKSQERNPKQFQRQIMEIVHSNPDVQIDLRMFQPNNREFRAYLQLKTDGTPVIAVLGGPQRAVIRWQAAKMVIRFNLDGAPPANGNGSRQAAAPPFTWTFSLSPDGKTLINDIHVSGDVTGDIIERLVFERAP